MATGKANFDAYLDDYAYLIDALCELFQVDSRAVWLNWARELATIMQSHFADPAGGYFYTAADHEQLVARSKDMADSSVPSGNAMAASGLLALGRLTEESEWLMLRSGHFKLARE